MTSRATRRSQAASVEPVARPADIPATTNIDRLVLAQAVWELGTGAWPAVAKLLSQHPLLSKPKSFFTAQSCHSIYTHLMKEAELETPTSTDIHAPVNLKLAQRHYQARLEELQEQIVAEETHFKTVAGEIQEILSGAWDKKLHADITGEPLEDDAQEEVTQPDVVATTPASEEVFGSELTGVTDPVSPPSDPQVDIALNDASTSPAAQVPEPSQDVDITVDEDIALPADLQGNVAPSADEASPQSPPEEATNTEETETEQPKEIDADIPIAVPTPPLDDDIHMEDTPADDIIVDDVPEEEVARPQAEVPGEVEEVVAPLEEQEEKTEPVPEDNSKQLTDDEASPEDVTEDVTMEPEQEAVPEPPEPEVVEEEPEVEAELHAEHKEATPATEPEQEPEHAEAHDEDGATSADEPLHTTRRSNRRRPSVSKGAKTRRQRREEELSPTVETVPSKEATPNVEEDQAPSPAVEPTGPRRQSKRKASVEDIDSPHDRKRARDDSEPAGEEDLGPTPGASRVRRRGDRTEEQVALKRFQYVIGMLHSEISQHRNGNIFHNPIKNSEAPDYRDIVKRPIDLKTIKTRVKDGVITNSLEYQRDIYLMFANAMMYNRPGSDIYAMAEDMMFDSEALIYTFRQTEGFVRGTNRA